MFCTWQICFQDAERQLTKELKNKDRELEGKDRELEGKDRDVELLTEKYTKVKDQIVELTDTIRETEREISILISEKTTLEKTVAQNDAEQAAKDRDIESLSNKGDDLKNDIADMSDAVREAQVRFSCFAPGKFVFRMLRGS